MQIILTIDIPADKLTELLKKDQLSYAAFREQMKSEFTAMAAEDLVPGATAKLEIKD